MSNNHPNRSWRSHWSVSLDNCTATHLDGWVFLFAVSADDPDALDGELIEQPQPLTEAHLRRAARIAHEAGVIYQEALDARH